MFLYVPIAENLFADACDGVMPDLKINNHLIKSFIYFFFSRGEWRYKLMS